MRHSQVVSLLLARQIGTFLPLSLWYLAHGEEVRGRRCLNLISIDNFVQQGYLDAFIAVDQLLWDAILVFRRIRLLHLS